MNRPTTLALTFVSLLCLAVALPAGNALASTMTLSFLVFPAGTPVPNMPSATIPGIQAGAAASVTAPAQVFQQGAAPGFTFRFWNAAAAVMTTPTATCTAPTDNSNFSCSAWYFEDVGGPKALVTTYAFSLNQNQVLAGKTPIAAVTPAGAWTGPPSTTVPTTTSAVTITAAALIGGFGRFNSWRQFGNGTIAGDTLSVPLMGGSQAIAFYGVPVPDPCAAIRAQRDNLNPSDFPTIQAYIAAFASLTAQLVACERVFGELP
jgi:hypothetical protein